MKLREFTVRYKKDIIVIAVLLAAALGTVLYISLSRSQGARAVVRIDGSICAVYSLESDGEYILNGGTNILTIENGTAYMSYADCPDKICMNTGKVRYNGQTITCLPNKVTVTIEEDDSGIDIITG